MTGKANAWLIGIIAFLLIAPLFFTLIQRSLIYIPSRQKPKRMSFGAKDMEEIKLKTSDNLILNAWYKKALEHKPTVIIFHGNAGHIGYRVPLALALTQNGFGVLLVEYRGYGGNPGKPSEHGLYKDANASIRFLEKNQIPPHKIALFGESLGSGVATQMALTHPKTCALILQSPFTSIAALAKHHYPWIPFTPRDKFDSLGRIQQIQVPLLILHGTIDTIVPFDEGKRLFETANSPKQFMTLKNQGHNELWTDEFMDAVAVFITKNCNM